MQLPVCFMRKAIFTLIFNIYTLFVCMKDTCFIFGLIVIACFMRKAIFFFMIHCTLVFVQDHLCLLKYSV